MWHHWREQNVDCGRPSEIPLFQILLLSRALLAVELPVLVHGDGWCSRYESFDMRDKRFSASSDIALDVFAAICRVVLILAHYQ